MITRDDSGDRWVECDWTGCSESADHPPERMLPEGWLAVNEAEAEGMMNFHQYCPKHAAGIKRCLREMKPVFQNEEKQTFGELIRDSNSPMVNTKVQFDGGDIVAFLPGSLGRYKVEASREIKQGRIVIPQEMVIYISNDDMVQLRSSLRIPPISVGNVTLLDFFNKLRWRLSGDATVSDSLIFVYIKDAVGQEHKVAISHPNWPPG